MITVNTTAGFRKWRDGLADDLARAKVIARTDRLGLGNPGDSKPVGNGVTEMRIHYGPGYRLYYVETQPLVYLLLCGGKKSTQDGDIRKAQELVKILRGEE